MDEKRFQELLDKRSRVGLSDLEADELGRMYAEQQGVPYTNAEDLRRAEAARRRPGEDRFRGERTRDQEKGLARR